MKFRFEIPECKRCCVCVPLRYGILTFGYLNLVFSLVILWTIWVWLDEYGDRYGLRSHAVTMYKGVEMLSQVWLPTTLYTLDAIFVIILLIGAHMKKVILMQVYYYYSITTTVAALAALLVVRWQYAYDYTIMELCLVVSALILQIYLLLIIRSELNKRRYKEGKMTYVNNAAEVVLSHSEGENPSQANAV